MSGSGASPGPVVDDTAHNRFVVEEDGAVAELVYHRHRDELALVHTEVPDPIGGRGIGGRLVAAAVEAARASGLTLVPFCPYASRWLRHHPDATAGVPVDWPEPGTDPARCGVSDH